MQEFTLAQFRLFSASASRRLHQDAAFLLYVVRVAAWGKPEDLEKLTRTLTS